MLRRVLLLAALATAIATPAAASPNDWNAAEIEAERICRVNSIKPILAVTSQYVRYYDKTLNELEHVLAAIRTAEETNDHNRLIELIGIRAQYEKNLGEAAAYIAAGHNEISDRLIRCGNAAQRALDSRPRSRPEYNYQGI